MFESKLETASPRCNSKRTHVATQGERCRENQLDNLRQQAQIDVATQGERCRNSVYVFQPALNEHRGQYQLSLGPRAVLPQPVCFSSSFCKVLP